MGRSTSVLLDSLSLVRVTVKSSPISGIPVTLDALEDVTPAYFDIKPAIYTITVPVEFEGRKFLKWEDGSVDSTREIEVTGNVEVVAYYEKYPWEESWFILVLIFGGIFIIATKEK